MSRRTTLIVIAVIALAGALIWRSRAQSAGIVVTAAIAERVPLLQSQVTASGEVVASRYAEIGANIMGRLVSLMVKEGDVVAAGQVVARIDSVQAESTADAADASLGALEAEAKAAATQVRAAQAAVDEARSRAAESASAFERGQQLRQAGLIAAADFDRVVATDAAAKAQVAAADASFERTQQAAAATERRVAQGRAERARARDQLSKTDITAPIDGVVTRLNVEVGEMVVIGVQNQPGTILMTVSDLSSINAEVKVAEADVMRLSMGNPATATLEALPGRKFPGKLVEIGASALPQVGSQAAAREFKVKVQLEGELQTLRPGLTCDAEILVAERSNVLTVPLQAVVQRPGPNGAPETGVFVVTDNTARFTPVKTGIIGGLTVEVDGVAEGAAIISGPFQVLREIQDGARVRTKAAAAPGR
jgi:HlyD family secretion protein